MLTIEPQHVRIPHVHGGDGGVLRGDGGECGLINGGGGFGHAPVAEFCGELHHLGFRLAPVALVREVEAVVDELVYGDRGYEVSHILAFLGGLRLIQDGDEVPLAVFCGHFSPQPH
ncbi:Uncharacterised protein [Chlamydia trachomatis]|nr:Uncharacterised protein [Chlamydia trachomatis]